jgi:signal transduction histidine kinase
LKWDLKRSTMDVVNDWITDLVTRTSYKSRFFEMFSKGNIFGSYEVGRIVISSAAYIATGNMDFLVAIEDDFYVQENVSKLMDIFARDRWPKRVKYQILAQDYIEIPADHFLAVGQAISNALTYGKRDRPAIGERDILVSVKCGQSHNEYTIEDQGQGIPGDKLPEIFGGYTSKGTGLGLQYVARIAGLRGGNVAVRSTEPGKETFESDLTKSEVSLVGKDEQQGTTFKLYLPKSHPNI